MDKHSEVEIKFAADKVTLKDYHDFVASLTGEFIKPNGVCRIDRYKAVGGKDTYFILAGQPLRFREGGDKESELTYKQRKSAASIADRVEINLPFKKGVGGFDVRALLGFLGAEEDFEIEKISYIYHLTGQTKTTTVEGHGQYTAVLALYDVTDEDGKTRRFLEVEIDAESSLCTPEVGLRVLDRWRKLIQNRLKVKGPLNQSLYEIYTTKGKTK